jgi:hypothetical protein
MVHWSGGCLLKLHTPLDSVRFESSPQTFVKRHESVQEGLSVAYSTAHTAILERWTISRLREAGGMKNDSLSDSPSSEGRAASLSKVLEQSRQLKDIVQECAKELSSVNADIQSELENQGSLPGVEKRSRKTRLSKTRYMEYPPSLRR